MTPPVRFSLVSYVLFSAVAGALVLGDTRRSLADDRAAEELNNAKARYSERVKATKKDVLREYDRRIAGIRRSNDLTTAARKDKLDQWTEAKSRFEDRSTGLLILRRIR